MVLAGPAKEKARISLKKKTRVTFYCGSHRQKDKPAPVENLHRKQPTGGGLGAFARFRGERRVEKVSS